jgi:hypothetical protein
MLPERGRPLAHERPAMGSRPPARPEPLRVHAASPHAMCLKTPFRTAFSSLMCAASQYRMCLQMSTSDYAIQQTDRTRKPHSPWRRSQICEKNRRCVTECVESAATKKIDRPHACGVQIRVLTTPWGSSRLGLSFAPVVAATRPVPVRRVHRDGRRRCFTHDQFTQTKE